MLIRIKSNRIVRLNEMKGKNKILFYGTPDFAVACLEQLLQDGFNIIGVVTAPDKPAGRGKKLQQSDVKKFALENKLDIYQPLNLKSAEFLNTLENLNPDIQVVVAFRMLPVQVWDFPKMGTINLHGSLLPDYRGAAPINWAIINGEKETGVTTFKLLHEIDTGNILMQKNFPIAETDNAGDVHDKMKTIGAQVLLETVKGLAAGTLIEVPQPSTSNQHPASSIQYPANLPHAPKIFTETCEIDFSKPVQEVYNLVRGLAPYPTAFTFLQEKKLKLYKTEKTTNNPRIDPGAFETDGKNYLQFACNDGFLKVLELQLEGKKKMPIVDFLRGYRF